MRLTRTGWRALAALAIAILLAFLYLPVLPHPFVYDDHVVIEKNRVLRSWGAAAGTFLRAEPVSGSDIGGSVFRPLSALSLAADYALWGLRPAGYHLTNLLLHAGSTIAAGLVARSLGAAEPVAWLAAALFAVHPIETEVVCWPSSRPEALFALFFLWAWAGRERLRARGRRGAAEAWGVALFSLALLSKEMAITFPLLLALREAWGPAPSAGPAAPGGATTAWGEGDAPRGRARAARALILVAPYAALAIAYFLWRTHVLGGLGSREQRADTLWLNVLTMSMVFARYVALLVWPAGQNVEHTVRVVESPLDPVGIACFAATLGCVAVAGWALRRRPAAGLGLAWFLVALLPVSNLIPIWSLMAERFLYVPSLGFFVCAAEILVGGRRHGRLRRAAAAAGVAALAFVTSVRIPVWADELRFWDDIVAKSPTRIKVHNNHGEVLLRLGRVREAEESFRRALDLNPRGPMANFNLGRVAEMRGDEAAAESYCRRALEVNPDLVDAWKTLGDLRLRAGAFREAEEAYREFLARRDEPEVRYNLAAALYGAGDLVRAGEEAGRAAALDPRLPEPHRLQGLVAQRLGRDAEAEEHYRRALALAPSADAHYNLAIVQERQGRLDQAIENLEAAARLAPRAPRVWEALSRVYREAGRPRESERAAARARDLSGAGSQ